MNENTLLKLSTPTSLRHHSLFLSDLHLGASGNRADLVLRFLADHVAEIYVLVGDILDFDHEEHWSQANQAVIDHLHARQVAGAKIVYVRGNHDPVAETVPVEKRLPVEALEQAVHVSPDGRRYLVVHGDAQDKRFFRGPWAFHFGSLVNRAVRKAERMIRVHVYDPGPQRLSFIQMLLRGINSGLYFRRAHVRSLIALARTGGFDGVICGHFHIAALHDYLGLTYANCGDWLDSFTALAIDFSGRMQLLGGIAPSKTSAAKGTF